VSENGMIRVPRSGADAISRCRWYRDQAYEFDQAELDPAD